MAEPSTFFELLRRITEAVQRGDLKKCLDALTEPICEHLGAQGCSVLVVLNGKKETARSNQLPPQVLNRLDTWERGIAKRLTDGYWTASWKDSPPVNEATIPQTDLKVFNTPLVIEDKVIGSFTLVTDKAHTLSLELKSQILNVASWLADMAMILHRVNVAFSRLRHLEVLFQIGRYMISTFDLNKVLLDTMEMASLILDAMAASLMLIREETQELVLEIVHGEAGETVRMVRSKVGEGIAGWVARHGKPALVNDVEKDPRFNPKVDSRTGVLTKSLLCVPLQIRGKTIGVLEVINKRTGEGFDQEDLKLLSTIAAQAAIAIENAKLYQSLKEERDRLIQAQEEIRKELARNLHDSTVQYLSAISMGLDHLAKLLEVKPEAVKAELEALKQMTKQAIRETRLLLFELRPLLLESQGLVPALKSYVEQLNSTESFYVKLDINNITSPIQRSVERVLFSIVQEAINNVKKHAHARHVHISLFTENGDLVLRIADDGVGFNVEEVLKKYDERGSLGLISMMERAKLIGGQLSIESKTRQPDRGTVVTVRVPEDKAFIKAPETAGE